MSFKSTTFATLLLSSFYLLAANAEVTPSAPGPGDSFNAGSTCTIVWSGDKDSTTVWKDMAIELMTGSNTGMVHITTVATGQDGTVDGKFEYTCPEVTPNSAIYFYQFTSPNTAATASTQWTTRFTIASSTGATTPESESTQPNGDAIPWGTGALVDPSTAVAAPSFGGAAAASGVVLPGASAASSSAAAGASTAEPSQSTTLTTVRATSTAGATSASSASVSRSASAAAASNSTSTEAADNSAVVFGAPMTRAAGVMAAGAAVFAFVL